MNWAVMSDVSDAMPLPSGLEGFDKQEHLGETQHFMELAQGSKTVMKLCSSTPDEFMDEWGELEAITDIGYWNWWKRIVSPYEFVVKICRGPVMES